MSPKPRVRRSVRSRWVAAKESVAFHLHPPDWSSLGLDSLPFGKEASELFVSELGRCRGYLEYGAGVSTVNAARLAPRVVTVESDLNFLRAVQTRLDADGAAVSTLHADIGPTGPWGAPVLKSRLWHQAGRWESYPLAPWLQLGREYRADLVLIDGRFRVACALAVISRQDDVAWTLLVDDYVERPEYHVIEEYAQLVEVRGRMASFAPRRGVDPREAEIARLAYMIDWR